MPVSSHLSPKENLLRAIQRNNPEYVPVRRMDGQIPGMVRLHYTNSMLYQAGTDRWGVRWEGGLQAGAEWEPRIQAYAVGHPLADLSDLPRCNFPDPQEPGMFGAMFEGLNGAAHLVLAEVPYLLFERAYLLMGMESFFVAASEQPGSVANLLRRIADYQIALIRRLAAHGVDAVRATDDYGGQKSLLMSPAMWRALIKPELARIVAATKDAGLLFFLHSCGHIMELVPDLVEIGVDVLDPIQAAANDHARLKAFYGDRLTFMYGVNSQGALSQGTPEEVDADVRQCIRLLAPGGGYILGPDNSVTIPQANYQAYLAAGERYGRYPLLF
jgi:uroporphyrinogen decarboxylase